MRKILNAALLHLRFLSTEITKSDIELRAISGKFFISKSLRDEDEITSPGRCADSGPVCSI
ncbi:MAG: hypothetical protein B1H11_02945 [Desulfobacteraceae bacterium 4484_190.1]|nr:MAG: hypothetical protein B1H11_02945 [Desulfobacteraceae bacterium 4484_190.1]